eukprot:Hpha_TRINITY_DN16404_c9_g1::TRINITY_DN16404_c9_g1_i1::g.161036::m.161036
MRVCHKQLLRIVAQEGDTAADLHVKVLAFPVSAFIGVFAGLTVFSFSNEGHFLSAIGASLVTLGCFVFAAGVLLNAAPPGRLLDIWLVVGLCGILAIDIANYSSSESFRSWTFVVLLLDAALVFGRVHLPYFIIPFTLLYLLFVTVDQFRGLSYGLAEAGFWGNDPEISKCNCASPPCGTTAMGCFIGFTSICMVFLLDFYFTRGFAQGMNRQLRRVKASVDVAADIAAALARYDVNEAEKVIQGGGDLPPELVDSYNRLLFNLRSYRDYLPEALLRSDDAGDLGTVPPPVTEGEREVSVGMVFTDIQSSTLLWEACPQEMYDALRTHNTALRAVAKKNEGYEVKIIGDALMLAFRSATNAVRFGAEAQLKLVESEWPPELCEHPLCQRVGGQDGVPLWHGVRVRIGINWGPVEAERNPVT